MTKSAGFAWRGNLPLLASSFQVPRAALSADKQIQRAMQSPPPVCPGLDTNGALVRSVGIAFFSHRLKFPLENAVTKIQQNICF